ncbi:uncharacterized protein NESG_00652 [Nematocida ausubeli]|uniref:Uncharacterized protein n=1 Tax=Nematocida ausubeli (strain ATCC PRA-371 / ERTm2) TaxID=1913371 RepID=A0A086J2Y6_NEMA1|nr:uncharacterized protein NESG_00652 [Nematocida ausubeli]KFG26504.1 hypothetical protein NESG_00652 [Nematocida ausubeli]
MQNTVESIGIVKEIYYGKQKTYILICSMLILATAILILFIIAFLYYQRRRDEGLLERAPEYYLIVNPAIAYYHLD